MQKSYRVEEYSYHVRWHDTDNAFIGTVDEFPSLSGVGDTLEDALAEVKQVVKAVLEDMTEGKEEIPETLSRRQYSGKFSLRMPTELHRSLAEKSIREDSSLNNLITTILAGAVESSSRVRTITPRARSKARIHTARVTRESRKASSKKAASRSKH